MNKAIDICVPVCPMAHQHRQIRRLFAQWGKAGIVSDGPFATVYYVTITDGDPCSWYTTTEAVLC